MFACSLPVHAVLVKAVLKQVVCARASFMSMCVFGLPPPLHVISQCYITISQASLPASFPSAQINTHTLTQKDVLSQSFQDTHPHIITLGGDTETQRQAAPASQR